MKRLAILVTLAAAGIIAPVSAQDTRNAELAHSNAMLNATYQALMRQLSPADQVALRTAERLWISFRDADCAVGWPDRRDCLGQRADERREQLRTSTYFDARGTLVRLP